MIIKYATKRNANGYRKFLGIDTERREFSRESRRWFCREDIIEISAADRKALIELCEASGYREIDFI